MTLASEHGFTHWADLGRILQGWAVAHKGQAMTGIALIRDGLAASEATGRRSTPLNLTRLAEALAIAGKIEEGLATLDDALATAAVSGERGWDAEIHSLRGELTGRLPYPDPAKAEDSFRTALAIAREQGTRAAHGGGVAGGPRHHRQPRNRPTAKSRGWPLSASSRC